MFNPRQRFLIWAVASLAGIWLAVWAGHSYFESLKMTADKVHAYVESADFSKLTGAARAKAIKELEEKLNSLSYEERQRLRMQHLLDDWFAKMTDDEKAQFIEATMPTGIKQMINAFEQLPQDKRRRAIDDAMKNLRASESGPRMSGTNAPPNGTNAPPPISPELEAKIRAVGLKTFYSQSSAETKAEAAPLLEELQHVMESGRLQRQP
ncbi:MAG TPA: hypothetical protein VKS19_08095 [Verrucomicrobiae bacterium]|nr:hypothetical protein [Verrucomicrobiae bacterium]